MFGLSEEIYNQIMKIVKKHKCNFLIFGSRARSDYRNNSDIDIAITTKISEKEENEIKNEFDLLDIPYTIDLVFVEKIEKKALIDSIKKEGVRLL